MSWFNILFLSLTPVIGVFGTMAYAIAYGVRWWEPTLFLVLFGLVSFSVTAGYHRCFAHKAYVAHPALQAFYLFFGAMALQNSALKWSSESRRSSEPCSAGHWEACSGEAFSASS